MEKTCIFYEAGAFFFPPFVSALDELILQAFIVFIY